MLVDEKKYSKPQFEVVVINSVDIMNDSDNSLGIEELLSTLRMV